SVFSGAGPSPGIVPFLPPPHSNHGGSTSPMPAVRQSEILDSQEWASPLCPVQVRLEARTLTAAADAAAVARAAAMVRSRSAERSDRTRDPTQSQARSASVDSGEASHPAPMPGQWPARDRSRTGIGGEGTP